MYLSTRDVDVDLDVGFDHLIGPEQWAIVVTEDGRHRNSLNFIYVQLKRMMNDDDVASSCPTPS